MPSNSQDIRATIIKLGEAIRNAAAYTGRVSGSSADADTNADASAIAAFSEKLESPDKKFLKIFKDDLGKAIAEINERGIVKILRQIPTESILEPIFYYSEYLKRSLDDLLMQLNEVRKEIFEVKQLNKSKDITPILAHSKKAVENRDEKLEATRKGFHSSMEYCAEQIQLHESDLTDEEYQDYAKKKIKENMADAKQRLGSYCTALEAHEKRICRVLELEAKVSPEKADLIRKEIGNKAPNSRKGNADFDRGWRIAPKRFEERKYISRAHYVIQ